MTSEDNLTSEMVASTRNGAHTAASNASAAMASPTPARGNGGGERDGISRLSQDFEPLHIGNTTASTQRHEIDALGVHVKQAISTISQLEGLGLASQKIPLPRIVVLGEQSTGKSSVIESISGIQTPRATGTCTRCPLFIKLEEAPAQKKWTAHVTLRRSYGFDGKKGPGSRQFPGWYKLPEPQEVEFMLTTKEADLEWIISRAQLATVSPLIDYREFQQHHDISHLDSEHRCSFSPNIVCINISCAGLPALSFYDLPGIIGQAENPDDVKFVKTLVMEYVKDVESLVLVTCSMENDIANSTAGGISRQLKATDRCIGVLTKPDRCHEINCAEVLRDVFDNKRFAFGHGYFVVRNPNQEQLTLGMTRDEARSQENCFFSENQVFSEFSNYNHRFGTSNLQAFLSCKLAEQITERLPIIQDEINTRLLTIEGELKHYPEPPSHNAVRIVFDTILNFTDNVRLELEGDYPCKEWRTRWTALQQVLFEALLSVKPTMSTSGCRDEGLYRASLGSSSHAILVPDDEEEDHYDSDNDVRMTVEPDTPSKKRKVEDTSSQSSTSKSMIPPEKVDKISLPDFAEHKRKFRLDDVSQHLEETSNGRVPDRIETKVIEAMMLEPLQHWALPVDAFFNELQKVLTSQIKILFDKYFKRWAGTSLYNAAWSIVTDMLDSNLLEQRNIMASDSLRDESFVHVFHKDIFKRDKDAVLETYKQARFKARLSSYKRERAHTAKSAKPLTANETTKLLKDPKFAALLAEEPYAREMDAVAEVSTYYMIAARRLHDALCMRVQSKFFQQLRTQLRDEMEGSLGIHDEHRGRQNAIALLTEDSEREQRRQILVAQRHSLLQGQKILQDLKQKKYGDDSSQTSEATVHDSGGDDSGGLSTPQSEDMDDV